MNAADAKKVIQEMADHSKKWHNGTSTRTRSTKTSDGLAAIQVQLKNLGREIKKVNEKVYAAQVGCESCKGPHYTKDCPLKEEVAHDQESLDHLDSPGSDLFSDNKDQFEEEETETMPKIDEKARFELKGQFLKELRDNTFSRSDNDDANDHIEKEQLLRCPKHYLTDMEEVILFYKGLDVPTRQILDSKGAIPSMNDADAKKSIQEMADHSKKWHNETSTRTRSTETSDGLAAIQAQLKNLGREIKKVNEKVYAAQVGCESCKGPYYTKDCPLKEEVKVFEEDFYT
ncbi:putative reverse transcriptase domain-containing protein [Tanacetum coccineum]